MEGGSDITGNGEGNFCVYESGSPIHFLQVIRVNDRRDIDRVANTPQYRLLPAYLQ